MTATMRSGSRVGQPQAHALRRFRILTATMLGLLLGQFLLGMANNLWLSVPESGPAWEKANPAILVYSHVILGAVMLCLGIWILVFTVGRHVATFTALSTVGLLGIVAAIGAGASYMGDTSNSALSFLMAAGSTMSIAAYAAAIAQTPAPRGEL